MASKRVKEHMLPKKAREKIDEGLDTELHNMLDPLAAKLNERTREDRIMVAEPPKEQSESGRQRKKAA